MLTQRTGIFCLDAGAQSLSIAWIHDDHVYSWKTDGCRQSDRLDRGLAQIAEKVGQPWSSIKTLVVNIGPGRFTSIRVGMAAILGIATAFDTPIWPLSGLAGDAYRYYLATHPQGRIPASDTGHLGTQTYAVLRDARMHEVYTGVYMCHAGQITQREKERIQPIAHIATWQQQQQGACLVGDTELLNSTTSDSSWTWAEAGVVAAYYHSQLGLLTTLSANEVRPQYLREQVASLPKDK